MWRNYIYIFILFLSFLMLLQSFFFDTVLPLHNMFVVTLQLILNDKKMRA